MFWFNRHRKPRPASDISEFEEAQLDNRGQWVTVSLCVAPGCKWMKWHIRKPPGGMDDELIAEALHTAAIRVMRRAGEAKR